MGACGRMQMLDYFTGTECVNTKINGNLKGRKNYAIGLFIRK